MIKQFEVRRIGIKYIFSECSNALRKGGQALVELYTRRFGIGKVKNKLASELVVFGE